MDGIGVYGSVLGYSMTIAYVGSAFLIFVYFFRKGSLGMDEEASLDMMKEDRDE